MRTFFLQFWWWWRNAPSTGLADRRNARNTHKIELTAPPSLLRSPEFFDNLFLLLSLLLSDVSTIFWQFWWWWP